VQRAVVLDVPYHDRRNVPLGSREENRRTGTRGMDLSTIIATKAPIGMTASCIRAPTAVAPRCQISMTP
jgi:hypothetical protein